MDDSEQEKPAGFSSRSSSSEDVATRPRPASTHGRSSKLSQQMFSARWCRVLFVTTMASAFLVLNRLLQGPTEIQDLLLYGLAGLLLGLIAEIQRS